MGSHYIVAKFALDLTTVVGMLLSGASIVFALLNYMTAGGAVGFLIAGGLIVNGIFVISAAQLGKAVLDTDISNREISI